MFDKLIESNSAEADFKPRRKFFMVSSVFVGILFLSAVVISLYAQEIDLGTDDFELARILAPVVTDAPEPPAPRENTQSQPQESNDKPKSELTSRQQAIAAIDHHQEPPSSISTTPNTQRSIPDYGPFTINPNAPESDGSRGTPGKGTEPTGTSSAGPAAVASEVVKADPPPVIVKKELPKTPQSKGVVNGIAITLPKPPYPPPARAINLTGTVNVQVLIDESGDVVSAKAVDGHAFFRPEAERAARKAKFKPTLLSDQPVKVTGVIVYKFSN